MNNIITTCIAIIFLGNLSRADNLTIRDPVFGSGVHADWDKFLDEEEQIETVVSSLIKGNWEYKATFTTGERLEITRLSQKNRKLQPLFDYNKNFPTTLGKIVPARIVDVFEDKNAIAMLLAVPNGYIYVKIINDLSQIDAGNLLIPPAGAGKGSWVVAKATWGHTALGVHMPMLGPDIGILGLNLETLDRAVLTLEGKNSAVITFTGDEVLRDGRPLKDSVTLKSPSYWTIDFFVDLLSQINKSTEEDAIKMWQLLVAKTEGGRNYVMKEFGKKLAHKPEVWKKVQELDEMAFAGK